MSTEYTLAVQIGEVEREIAMRQSVYPGRVDRGLMKRADMDNRIGILKEVVRTLQGLRETHLHVIHKIVSDDL